MRVAIIHDWLTGMRGGEKCLEIFCELFPDADIYTLFYIKGKLSEKIESMNIKSSFLQKFPFIENFYRYYLPLFPTAIEQFDLRDYNLIISSSHCVAKGVIPPKYALHICYCYTPMRYIWDMYYTYFPSNLNPLSRILIPIFSNYLRIWDIISANRVNKFIGISKNVAERIKRIYNRKAEVIYPPVDCSFFKPGNNSSDYYLIVSALSPYKRLDIAIEAFNRLEYPLKIIGEGPEKKRLKFIAKSNIEFLGWVDDYELLNYYRGCKGLIFPGEEDFGIVLLEAQAVGKPVIAYGKGGALENVRGIYPPYISMKDYSSYSGIFFNEDTSDSLIKAIEYFESISECFNKEDIRNNALRFDKTIFKNRIKEFIEVEYGKKI